MPARHHRVTRGDDYRRIVREGRRVGGALCVTHAVSHTQGRDAADPEAMSAAGSGVRGAERPARFGFIVSKAVGGAVTRNLVRRRLKSIVERSIAAGFTGADVVFRALPASADASFAELEREVTRSLDRVRRPAGGEARDVRQ